MKLAFLTMFFVVDPIPASQTEVKVLILAHGNGIATEMANVANELLGIEEVTGIDMPLHESPKDFLERVKVYMKTLQKCKWASLTCRYGVTCLYR